MSDNSALLAALKQALDQDASNGPLWAHYGEMLASAGRSKAAIDALRKAAELKAASTSVIAKLTALLRADGQLAEALIRAEQALEATDDPMLRLELARTLLARGDLSAGAAQYRRAIERNPSLDTPELQAAFDEAAAPPVDDTPDDAAEDLPEAEDVEDPSYGDPIAAEVNLERAKTWDDFEVETTRVTFADVAGLDDVKRQINLRIIAPFKKQDIFKAFSRSGGGGILLYGPPGCGKTFIARATAGEVGARFIAIGIHEIIDKYWGESEKAVHAVFDEARCRAPTILFFDEFDALGATRGRGESQFWKTLVDQLLQEMDGIGGRNENVLVFAATNSPWNVDPAFRRPGRFDRLLFVPPPDQPARLEMLRRHAAQLPGGDKLKLDALGAKTELFTGADLRSLCERASEAALAKSLESDKVHPIVLDDFMRELKSMTSSAGEWLATARNYARYSNESGQFNDLADYLRRVKKW
jgi:SpoVK/Ycf46/Vps4 family AAA+-type ATPase